MTFAFRAALALFALPLLQPAQVPGIELADFGGEPGFTAKVDGKSVKLVLSPRWPSSYLLGGDGSQKSVLVDGQPLVKVPLEEIGKESLFPNADGVLGLDALQKLCLVIDPIWERMEILPRTKLGLSGAQTYFSKLPAWGSSKVVRIPLTPGPMGTPLISATIGGNKTPMIFSMSLYNTMLDDKVSRPKEVVGPENWSFMPNVAYPGLAPGWFSYFTPKDWNPSDEGGHGMIGLDTFASRKVIVDLADNAIYVEELAPDVRLAFALYRIADLPVSISGDTVTIAEMPGIIDDEAVGPLNGCKILKLAGIPIAEWLADLRGKTPDAGAKISQRALLFDKVFEVTVLQPDGTEKTVPIDGKASQRPGDTF